MPHFCPGLSNTTVAFIFSAPGRREAEEGVPVAGITGKNLDAALKILHRESPALFPSTSRYEFRISNAYVGVLHKNKDGRTEGTKREILDDGNIARVLKDIAGVKVVILCGLKPGYLRDRITNAGFYTAIACHCGNRGLSQTFQNSHPSLKGIKNSTERTSKRTELWAHDILRQLPEESTGGA